MSSQRLLIIGVILGIVTVVLLNLYVGQIQSSQESVQVLSLSPEVTLPKGQPVTAEMLTTVGLPAEFGSIVERAVGAEASSWIIGRSVTTDVPAGSILLYEHFEEEPEERFAARISEGMRALTIPVDATSAVAYFVEPGSRVDIIGTLEEQREVVDQVSGQGGDYQVPLVTEKVSTKTLLQNVRVLAVGRATTRGSYLGTVGAVDDGYGDDSFATVTIEVTPLQAEKIIFALEHAQPDRALTLVLRNPADERENNLPQVDWTQFDTIR